MAETKAHRVLVTGLTVKQVIDVLTTAQAGINRQTTLALQRHGEDSPITKGFEQLKRELDNATVDPA